MKKNEDEYHQGWSKTNELDLLGKTPTSANLMSSLRTDSAKNSKRTRRVPVNLWLSLSPLLVLLSGALLGAFVVDWIRTPLNSYYIEEWGERRFDALVAPLPASWEGSIRTAFPQSMVDLLPGAIAGAIGLLLVWFVGGVCASWQNCLLFTTSLRLLATGFLPLLLYAPLVKLHEPPNLSLPFPVPLIPAGLSVVALAFVFRRIQKSCLHSESREPVRATATWSIPWCLAVVSAFGFFVVWAVLACERHNRFQSQGYDLGLMSHILKGFITGEGFTSSLIVSGGSFLGHHFSPILLVAVPFYYFCPHPETLLILQSAVLAAAALTLFRFAERVLESSWGALAVSLTYLMLPGLSDGAFGDFHAIAFAPFLLYWLAFVSFESVPRPFRILPPLLLFLCVQENLVLYALAFAASLFVASYLLQKERNFAHLRTSAAWIAGISTLWGGFVFLLVPQFLQSSGEMGFGFVQRYQDFLPPGTDPREVGVPGLISLILSQPGTAVELFFDSDRLKAYNRLLFGSLYFPLLNPASWPLFVPLLETILCSETYLHKWGGHYGIAPAMVAAPALVLSLAFARRRWSRWSVAVVAWVLCLGTFWWSSAVSPLPLSRELPSMVFSRNHAPVGLERVLQTYIPFGKSISAQSHLLPHLTHQTDIFLLPPGDPVYPLPGKPSFVKGDPKQKPSTGWPDFLVYDPGSPRPLDWYNRWYLSDAETRNWVEGQIALGRYELALEVEYVRILKRKENSE